MLAAQEKCDDVAHQAQQPRRKHVEAREVEDRQPDINSGRQQHGARRAGVKIEAPFVFGSFVPAARDREDDEDAGERGNATQTQGHADATH